MLNLDFFLSAYALGNFICSISSSLLLVLGLLFKYYTIQNL